MPKVKSGDTVRLHYHGTLDNGEVFDSSKGRAPFEFTVGAGQVIKGFDNGVMDMEPGETKTIHIPVNDAYGPREEENMVEVPRADLPGDIDPQVGLELHMSDDQGHVFPVTIAEVKEDSILLDGNHALAGKDLIFELELLEIL